ncbi:MAG: AMP-binding protein, partial [Anaerolineae bacterium]
MPVTYADKPWIKQYDQGIPAAIEIPDYPLHQFLIDSAQKYPDHTAIIFKDKTLTYRQLDELTDAFAAGLAANGFKKGDRAVIYTANTPQFVISYFGILKAGGIAIATNPLYTERELEHQLADCGAETVIVMSRYYPLLKRVQKSGKTNVKRIIATNIKEYFPGFLKILFTLLVEKKEGDRVNLEAGDMWFQDFIA